MVTHCFYFLKFWNVLSIYRQEMSVLSIYLFLRKILTCAIKIFSVRTKAKLKLNITKHRIWNKKDTKMLCIYEQSQQILQHGFLIHSKGRFWLYQYFLFFGQMALKKKGRASNFKIVILLFCFVMLFRGQKLDGASEYIFFDIFLHL